MKTQSIYKDNKDNKKFVQNPNRAKLVSLSETMRFLRVSDGEFEGCTINEMLLNHYSNGEDWEFNTFRQWEEKGFKVKKGEKAFLAWGRKRKVEQDKNPEEDSKAYKFFPICYLFSEFQVEPIK